jgi:EAL domain-containing protein (putative c-di-GMP-specific phosphodiesterase class I)
MGQLIDIGVRGRVLLVDDDASIRRDYARVLEREGYLVEVAADGSEGLALLEQSRFDAIITDIEMPALGGLDFLRAVRERDLFAPVLLITGVPVLESAISAVEYGAFAYLVKPVPSEALAHAVRRAVNLRKLAALRREAWELAGAEGLQLSDRASLDARFERALEGVHVVYQPIVRWASACVLGYEAFVRSTEPSLPHPNDLFDAAERLDRVFDLGRRIRARIAEDARSLPEGALLFVNVNAGELNDHELSSSSSPLAPLAERVVVEITERSALDSVSGLATRDSVSGLATRMARLRRLGFRIALDDLGAGYASLSSFSLLEPDFVKLDMSLVRGVDAMCRKQSIVRGVAQLCGRDLGIEVIAEGVETAAECAALVAAGVDVVQGYYLARPGPGFSVPGWG